MLKFKKCVAAMLALIMVLSLCACGNKAEEQPTEPTNNEIVETTPTEGDIRPTVPEKSEKEKQEEERLKKKNINFGQIIFHGIKSDLTITVDSDYFKETKDVVKANSEEVESTATRFIEEMSYNGVVHIARMNTNLRYGDKVKIGIGENNNLFRCSLHADEVDLNIDSEGANAIEFALFNQYVKIDGARGPFFYDLMGMRENGMSHLSINGHADEDTVVEIYKDGDVCFVKSDKPLQGINVMAMGFGDEPSDESQMGDCMESSCYYEIWINSDGTVTIFAQ